MTTRRATHGSLLIDLMVALAASLFVGAGLTIMIQSTYSSQSTVQNNNEDYVSARKALDIIAAHIQNAQNYPTTKACVATASSSQVTFFTSTGGNTERYWINTTATPIALDRQSTVGGVSTTTAVAYGIQSLSFTYYLTDGTDYNAASFVSTTTAPVTTDLPKIGAIGISVVVSSNGVQQTVNSFVRLRNSPYR